MNRTNLLDENFFDYAGYDFNAKSFLSNNESSKVYRLLRAPGDILGQIDLLNGRKYTETCRCLTNTLPSNTTKQERLHIYGYLKYSLLIPNSYLINYPVIYSLHELILIQDQLQNILSSLTYTGPCFIQTEIGQCGLQPVNRTETRILVLRSTHHIHQDEFVRPNDLPDLSTHVIYDHRLAIFLPRISEEYEDVFTSSDGDEISMTTRNQK